MKGSEAVSSGNAIKQRTLLDYIISHFSEKEKPFFIKSTFSLYIFDDKSDNIPTAEKQTQEKTLYKRKNTAVCTFFTETAVIFRFQRNIPFLAILHKKQH